MRQLYYGGSFNPVHRAHLICSAAAARAGGFDEVVLVPSHQPVLKSRSYDLASAEDRLAMLLIAAKSDNPEAVRFSVDPLELSRDGPTYTIDTVDHLRKIGHTEVHWLIGADQVANLPRWHQCEALLRKAQFWVMARPGYPWNWAAMPDFVQKLQNHVLTVPQIDISATQIRTHVQQGLPIDQWVLPEVREYIIRRRLYIP